MGSHTNLRQNCAQTCLHQIFSKRVTSWNWNTLSLCALRTYFWFGLHDYYFVFNNENPQKFTISSLFWCFLSYACTQKNTVYFCFFYTTSRFQSLIEVSSMKLSYFCYDPINIFTLGFPFLSLSFYDLNSLPFNALLVNYMMSFVYICQFIRVMPNEIRVESLNSYNINTHRVFFMNVWLYYYNLFGCLKLKQKIRTREDTVSHFSSSHLTIIIRHLTFFVRRH